NPTAEGAEERREQPRPVLSLRTSASSAVGCTNLGCFDLTSDGGTVGRIWNSQLHHYSSASNARDEGNRESKTSSSRLLMEPAARPCMNWSKGCFSITSATHCSKRLKTRPFSKSQDMTVRRAWLLRRILTSSPRFSFLAEISAVWPSAVRSMTW